MQALKSIVMILAVFCMALPQSAQGADKPGLITGLPETWPKEVIPFPLTFAPTIPLEGIEELRFAPGMFKPDANDYFHYAFLWQLDGNPNLAKDTIQTYLRLYYNGLFVAASQSEKTAKTAALKNFTYAMEAIDAGRQKGTIMWEDPFNKDRPIQLYLETQSEYCERTNKTNMLFIIKPVESESKVWNSLRSLKLPTC